MRRSSAPPTGFTLVELMVVVALIAILAGLAIASFSDTVDKGKITEMKRYAKDVERGQQQYASRNNRYLDPAENPAPNNTVYTQGDDEWEQLLEFQPNNLPPNLRVMAVAGTGEGGGCGNFCPDNLEPDDDQNWYAIKVCRDLDKSGTGSGTTCGDETTVYLDNARDDPYVLREGQ